jgi:hypothetical protein
MEEKEDVPLPKEDAKVEWKHASIQLDFHPAIKLTRKLGLEFAGKLTDWLEPIDVQLEAGEWRFLGGAACEGVEIRVVARSIVIRVSEPQNALEFYEDRFQVFLDEFHSSFSPSVALRTRILVGGLLGLPNDEDVLPFLGAWVMAMHPYKFKALGRPLHILGIRVTLPPTIADGSEPGIDWSADVRIETWTADEKKLYLETDAEWDDVETWDKDLCHTVTHQRLRETSTFLSDRIIKFLRQPPFPDEEDNDSPNEHHPND